MSKRAKPASAADQEAALSACASSEAEPAARLRAAVILEVLAGQRTAGEGAEALGLSVNHYYLLERRALAGLLEACRPRPRGPRPEQALERKAAALERELQRALHECRRQAALVRATQRALGLPAAAPEPAGDKKAAKTKGRGSRGKKPRKRKRQPSVRALRAAEALREEEAAAPEEKTLAAETDAAVQPTDGRQAATPSGPSDSDHVQEGGSS